MSNPNTPVFPTAIAADTDLPVASNSFSTSLTGTIDSSVTTLPVVTTVGCNVPCIIRLENEIVLAVTKTINSFTGCIRGFDGSSPVSHNSGVVVAAYIFDWHNNQIAAEIKAIETFLGINGANLILSGQSGTSTDLIGNFPTLNLKTTGITPGAYSNPALTVDSKGRITVIASNATPIVYRAAIAQSGVGILGLNGPTGNSPTAAAYEAGNTVYGVAQFSVGNYIQDHFIIPPTYSGTITAEIRWRAVAISGNCNWTLSFAGVDAGDLFDATFDTAGTVTPSPAGTTKQIVHTTITGFAVTSLGPNKDCIFKLKRDSAGDTMTGVAELFSIRFLLS